MKSGGSGKKKKRTSSSGSSPASPELSTLSPIDGDITCSPGEMDKTSIFQRTLDVGEISNREGEAAAIARYKKKMKLSDSAGTITTDINIDAITGDTQDGETAPDNDNDERESNDGMDEATVEETASPTGGAGNNVVLKSQFSFQP